jgi:hypothetical protein
VVIGLVAAIVLGFGAGGFVIYLAAKSWQRNLQSQFGVAIAPATPKNQGVLEEVARFGVGDKTVQALGGGDVDGDGQAEGVLWVDKQLSIRDQVGKEEASFAHGLKSVDVPSLGGYAPPGVFGGIRTPLVAKLQGAPAVVVTDGEGEVVYAYRADGSRVLEDRVKYTHVVCVRVADLEGDGEDELLVGRSAQVGLICRDARGRERWKHGATSDPRWVCVGDGNADKKPEVFVGYDTSSAHILDRSGKQIGTWSTFRLESSVTSADVDADGRADFFAAMLPMPGAGSKGPSMSQGVKVEGIDATGNTLWEAPLVNTQYWWGSLHLAAADLDGDGKGEWISSAPDGTLRLLDAQGNERGRHGLGAEIGTLAVVGPDAPGGKPHLWVSLGKEVVLLRWR